LRRRRSRKKYYAKPISSSYKPKNYGISKGEYYQVTIRELSRKGQGVARIKGLVVFVPHAKIGQRLTIRIKEIKGRYAIGEIVG